jgi:hypothetical protein
MLRANKLYDPVQHPVRHAFVAPAARLWDTPSYSKILSAVTGLVGIIWNDVITLLLCLLFIFSVWDFVLGREVARQNGTLSTDRARVGWLTKGTSIFLVMGIRVFEFWGWQHGIPGLEHSNGFAAAAVGMAFWVGELESIVGHQVALGAKPNRVIGPLVRVFHIIEGRILAFVGAKEIGVGK